MLFNNNNLPSIIALSVVEDVSSVELGWNEESSSVEKGSCSETENKHLF